MDGLGNQLFQYGIAGIFILVLLYVVKRLDDRCTDSFEKRLVDKEAITIALRNSTDAINGHTRAVEALTEIVKHPR